MELFQKNTSVLEGDSNKKEEKPEFVEPLLKENPNRFVIFPLRHHDIWQFYKKAVASFWTVEEVNFFFFVRKSHVVVVKNFRLTWEKI